SGSSATCGACDPTYIEQNSTTCIADPCMTNNGGCGDRTCILVGGNPSCGGCRTPGEIPGPGMMCGPDLCDATFKDGCASQHRAPCTSTTRNPSCGKCQDPYMEMGKECVLPPPPPPPEAGSGG